MDERIKIEGDADVAMQEALDGCRHHGRADG
jgi:hypothetical protein